MSAFSKLPLPKWSTEELRAREMAVKMGCDAFRICTNMDPIHFPHEDVIQWMNTLRRQPMPKPAYRLQFNKATKKIDRVQIGIGLVADSFDPPEEC